MSRSWVQSPASNPTIPSRRWIWCWDESVALIVRTSLASRVDPHVARGGFDGSGNHDSTTEGRRELRRCTLTLIAWFLENSLLSFCMSGLGSVTSLPWLLSRVSTTMLACHLLHGWDPVDRNLNYLGGFARSWPAASLVRISKDPRPRSSRRWRRGSMSSCLRSGTVVRRVGWWRWSRRAVQTGQKNRRGKGVFGERWRLI